MALNLNPPSDQGIKNNMVETKEESCSQSAECQRELKGLKKRLLRAEANAYLLAKHLQEHRKFCGCNPKMCRVFDFTCLTHDRPVFLGSFIPSIQCIICSYFLRRGEVSISHENEISTSADLPCFLCGIGWGVR